MECHYCASPALYFERYTWWDLYCSNNRFTSSIISIIYYVLIANWNIKVGVPEWLSGMTRNHVGFARAGSNPAAHDYFLFSFFANLYVIN